MMKSSKFQQSESVMNHNQGRSYWREKVVTSQQGRLVGNCRESTFELENHGNRRAEMTKFTRSYDLNL